MPIPSYFRYVSFFFLGFLLTTCKVKETKRSPHPNIIILLADDLGYGDLSCYGNALIRTPHLDKMAGAGSRLTSFYMAASKCTPSRAALLTGRYPIRTGLTEVLNAKSEIGLPADEITLAEARFRFWH